MQLDVSPLVNAVARLEDQEVPDVRFVQLDGESDPRETRPDDHDFMVLDAHV